MEKYMESFRESISKRFEKHENYFKNLTDKVKSFEITHREYKKRLSRLEDQGNTDENETIELQQVANLNFSLFFIFFSFFDLHQFQNHFVLGEIQIRKTVRDKIHSREIGNSLF